MEALEHPLTYAHFQFSKPSPAAGKLLIVAGNPEENNNDSTAIGIGPSNFRAEAMLRGGKRRSRDQGKPPSAANYWSQESEFNLVTNRMALRQDLCQAPTALLLRAIQIGPHCSNFSDPLDRTGSGCIPTLLVVAVRLSRCLFRPLLRQQESGRTRNRMRFGKAQQPVVA